MLQAFGAAFAHLDTHPDCRVILIRGEGRSFCAGWDTNEFAQLAALGSDGLNAAFAANADVLAMIGASNRVVVTAITGACMGFGISLAARSDLCLAADNARFALPELDHGIVPGMVLGDAINALGARRAMDWVLTRQKQSAEQALAAGLVDRVFEAAAFDAQVEAMLTTLAQPSLAAIAATKALARLHHQQDDFLQRAIATSTQSVLSLFAEGVSQ